MQAWLRGSFFVLEYRVFRVLGCGTVSVGENW